MSFITMSLPMYPFSVVVFVKIHINETTHSTTICYVYISEYENTGSREPLWLPYLLSKISWHTGYIIHRINHSIIFVKFLSQ